MTNPIPKQIRAVATAVVEAVTAASGVAVPTVEEAAAAWLRDIQRKAAQARQQGELGEVKRLLEAAGKSWFYLDLPKDSHVSGRFWLNPMEQQDNNCGRFTLDELRAWARDEGPVPKKRR